MINDSLATINLSEALHAATSPVGNQGAFPPLRLESRSLATSAAMFAAGVLGNLVALVALCVSKREQKETTFYMLVCGMAVTDLLGTCFTSPVVIAAYVASRWPGGTALCHFFSFSMLFFGSAGMSILCAMAVERYLAINRAYFYSRHVDRATARAALAGIYLANAALCAAPSLGFGRHARHFPGTWCFLDWRAADPLAASYALLYGGVMLALVAATVSCNFAVCRSLVVMNQRAPAARAEEGGARGGGGARRRHRLPRLSPATSTAEIQMFWLLIFMTVVFLVCSIPLVVRIFVNQLRDPAYISAGGKPDYRSDLLAIRFASFNPILDPWVYILCRKNLLVKGCGRLKRTVVGRNKEGPDHSMGWVGGRHSPPSFDRSNATSYASLRTASYRNDGEGQPLPAQTRTLLDVALRQAWDHDSARPGFHPFSVESTAGLGREAGAGVGAGAGAAGTKAAPAGSPIRKPDVVTCAFGTPSSRDSEKCL